MSRVTTALNLCTFAKQRYLQILSPCYQQCYRFSYDNYANKNISASLSYYCNIQVPSKLDIASTSQSLVRQSGLVRVDWSDTVTLNKQLELVNTQVWEYTNLRIHNSCRQDQANMNIDLFWKAWRSP